MLYQQISEDPDVAQAAVDYRDVALEIRDRRGQAERLPARAQLAEQFQISELVDQVAPRADRLGMHVEELLQLIFVTLDSKPPAPAASAVRKSSKQLAVALSQAKVRERLARDAIVSAQVELVAATAARVAAEQAIIGPNAAKARS